MADETSKDSSPKNEPTHVETNEDAETRATRRELKQSSISDPASTSANATVENGDDDDKAERPSTPPTDLSSAHKEDDKEQVLSPKKKRSHDQLGEDQETEDIDATSTTSTDSAKDRASRLEPEKKRHRDADAGGDETDKSKTEATTAKSPAEKTTQTSSSAFAASGFGKMSSTSSPFASLGSTKGIGFGAPAAQPLSSFASPAPVTTGKPAEAPKLTFGGGSSASPFAGLAGKPANGFGSAFGSGASTNSAFGSALSGIKPLASFAAPGSNPLQAGKPARPFGAPDSDADDNGEDDEAEGEDQPDEERAASPEKEKETDEKKKPKLHKVEVDDGEAGETTIVSVRAKVFHHDKEMGWKERGAGMLKVNVPEACVEFDDAGIPVPGSFDASGLEADEEEANKGSKVARLILRQDQTHRILLNTVILPTMKFQEKASLKAVVIVFTAFEGADAKPVSITVKMSTANAKTFMNEVGVIQKELLS